MEYGVEMRIILIIQVYLLNIYQTVFIINYNTDEYYRKTLTSSDPVMVQIYSHFANYYVNY